MAKLEIGTALAVVVAIGSSAGWNYERMQRAKAGDMVIESRLTRVEATLEVVHDSVKDIERILREGYRSEQSRSGGIGRSTRDGGAGAG